MQKSALHNAVCPSRRNGMLLLKELVDNGAGTVNELSKRSFLARSSVEYFLRDLKKRGLVKIVEINGRRKYGLQKREKILEYFRACQENEYDFYDQFCESFGKYLDIKTPQTPWPGIEYYYGHQGIRNIHMKMLESRTVIRSYLPNPYSLYNSYPEYEREFVAGAIQNKLKMNTIVDATLQGNYEQMMSEQQEEVRYLGRSSSMDFSISMFDGQVLFIAFENECALLLADKNICAMMRVKFEEDWRRAGTCKIF